MCEWGVGGVGSMCEGVGVGGVCEGGECVQGVNGVCEG